jgi:UDP-N-acetylglucosamine 2-epimerase
MVHIIVGTKAQFIKMVPIMKELESRGVTFNFINLGQHAGTVSRLLRQFKVQDSKSRTQDSGAKDVSSIIAMVKWLAVHLITIAFRPKYLLEQIFKAQDGIAFIHGDTLSTLVGLFMAKRAGLRVGHVESGLRSRNYLHPFPEELIRVFCMKYSDYLFAPSEEAVDNLNKMKIKGRIFNTHGNTGMDAITSVQSSESRVNTSGKALSCPFVLVSIHRFENLYSRKRSRFILDTVDEVSEKFHVIFVMHGPTVRRLRKAGAGGQGGESANITYLPLQDHSGFLELIKNAEFVITDGGSVQEECYYIGKPCLIMRKRTEREAGLERNAILGSFDKTATDAFIRDYGNYKKPALVPQKSPSAMFVDEILKL